jgi:hypothetical protein
MGVDVSHFWVLLSAKLKMDFRRAPNSFQSAGKKQTMLKQLFIYGFLGAVLVLSLYRISDLMLQLSVFFTFLMVFEGTILLTEFTAVLFDEKDNQILLPRPVSSRTLLLVRLMHILVYMSNIAFALSLPFAIYLSFVHGWLALIFILVVLMCAWLTLIMATGFYMSLSKFVSAVRFKDVLNYFQIGLAVIIMASYQLVPHFMEDAHVETFVFKEAWWIYLVPTVWFAGLVNFLVGIGGSMEIILSIITVFVVLIGTVLLVRALSSGFTNIISETGTGSIQKAQVSQVKAQKGWKNKLIALLCVSNEEQTGWRLTMSHIRSDRKLKQQVYPMFAYSLIMALVFLKPDINDFSAYLAELSNSSKYLFFVLTGFFGTVGISVIPYTDTPNAAWIYEVASTSKKYHIQSGAVKAMLFTFYLPLQVLFLVPVIWIWGLHVLPYFLLASALTAALSIVLVRMQGNELPFSQGREMVNKGEYTLRMFLGMFFIGLLMGLVYLISMVHIAVGLTLCALMPLVISMSYRSIRSRQ